MLDCGSPDIPDYGHLVSMSGTTYGESAYFTCRKGYYLLTGNSSTCGQEGWSVLPSCEGEIDMIGVFQMFCHCTTQFKPCVSKSKSNIRMYIKNSNDIRINVRKQQ